MSQEQAKNNFPDFSYRVILFIASFPLAIIVGRWLPQMILPISKDGFDVHFLVALLVSTISLQIVLFPFRKILSVLGTISAVILAIMIYRKDISTHDLKNYYWRGVAEVTNKEYGGKSMDYQSSIERAIADNAGLEEFVIQIKSKYEGQTHFSKPILTSFALFNNVSCQWEHKDDPQNRELFRPVSETIETLTGDCDDHAICLASCMKESGARARIIHMDGHLYPELYVGKKTDEDAILNDIRKIYPLSCDKKIHFNNDAGELWLSMDYTEKYPGGENLGTYRLETMELK